MAPHQYHFTLKFLGETLEEGLSAVRVAVERAAERTAPFDLDLEGLGAFPDAGPPRGVWAGCGEGRKALVALARAVEETFGEAGFPREVRPFSPHLTVGRIKEPRSIPVRPFREALAQEAGTRFGTVPARELVLFRSDLSPAGPTYVALVRAPLGGPPAPAVVTPGF